MNCCFGLEMSDVLTLDQVLAAWLDSGLRVHRGLRRQQPRRRRRRELLRGRGRHQLRGLP